MPDVAEQIRAWADAAAPAGAVPRSGRPEVSVLDVRSARRRPPRLLAAAAILVFVAALAGLVLAVDRDPPQSVTTGPTDDTAPGAGRVTYRELGGSTATSVGLGSLQAATTPSELAGLWAVVGLEDEPVPSVDFDREIVVAMTVLDHTCALTFEGFDRSGETVTARFDQPSSGCERTPLPSSFVVAVDRASVGAPDAADSFRLVLPHQPDSELGETILDVGGVVPGVAGATAAFHLSADTMEAGSTIAGTVQVYNNADEILEAATCGPYFVAVLEGEAATQFYSRPRCAERFVVPPGISSYPVTAKGSFLTCINGEASELVPACLPDGSMPTLPPGTYEARVVQPDDAIPVSGPITVTVT